METSEIIGLVLIAAGLLDAVMARFVVGPRIEDQRQRSMVVASLILSGVMMVLVGGAILGGVVDLG